MRTTEDAAQPLVRDADKLLACIHCGFCLSACPTYTRLGLEMDSPRGRLDLMRAVVEGRLPPDAEGFTRHIDRCLGCRACETACPAGVQYGFLLERSRQVIGNVRGHRFATRVLLTIFGQRALARSMGVAGRLLLATRLVPWLVRALPGRASFARFGLAMLGATRAWTGLRTIGARGAASVVAAGRDPIETAAVVPSEHHVADHPALAPGVTTGDAGDVPLDRHSKTTAVEEQASYDADDVSRRIAILTGCAQQALFGRVNAATERVLAANGCRLQHVPAQRCCGALHAHAGELERARELARANIDAFERAGVDNVVVNAAGCGAMMKEYHELLKDDARWAARAHAFSARVRDLFEYLDARGARVGAPLPARIAYDAPCHLYHAQRITRSPLDVLASVPELDVVPVPDFEDCCGGAGIYALEHPELGGRIARDKLDACRATGAIAVVTPNPGCIMQIGAGFLLEGEDVPVVHPVELLDESYRRAGFY